MEKILIQIDVKDELPGKENIYMTDIGTRWFFSQWSLLAEDVKTPEWWLKEISEEEYLKKHACAFFRWWWNKPGNNTEQGFDKWYKTEYLKQKR